MHKPACAHGKVQVKSSEISVILGVKKGGIIIKAQIRVKIRISKNI